MKKRNNKTTFFSINSSYEVISSLKEFSCVKSFYSADFTRLFTSLPQDPIIDSIGYLLDLWSKNNSKFHIVYNSGLVCSKYDRKLFFSDSMTHSSRFNTISILRNCRPTGHRNQRALYSVQRWYL